MAKDPSFDDISLDDDIFSDLDYEEDSFSEGFEVGDEVDSDKVRTPILNLKQATKDISTLGNAAMGGAALAIGEKVKRAFPDVGNTVSDVLNVVGDAQRMRDDVIQEARPLINQSKILAKQVARYSEDLIPTGIYKKIMDKLGPDEEERDGKVDKSQAREDKVSQELNDIFKAQTNIRIAERKQDAVRKFMDDKIASSRHAESFGAMSDIRTQMVFQTKFYKSTFTAYMKKSLELKYRSLFMAEDMLEIAKLSAKMLEEKLDAIRHNTALPETDKITLVERLKHQGKEAMVGYFRNAVGSKLSKYFGDAMKKVKEEFIAPMFENVGSLTDGLSTMMEMLQSEAEMGGRNAKRNTLFSWGGTALGGLLGAIGGKKLLKMIPKDTRQVLTDKSKTTSTALMLYLDQLRRGEIEVGESFGLGDILDRILPEIKRNEFKMQTRVNETNLDEAGKITNRFTHTVEEIIPGLLSKQLQMLTILATGNKDTEEVVWSFKDNDFIKVSAYQEDIRRKLTGSEEQRIAKMRSSVDLMNKAIQTKEENGKITYHYGKTLVDELQMYRKDYAVFIRNLASAKRFWSKEDPETGKMKSAGVIALEDIQQMSYARSDEQIQTLMSKKDSFCATAFKGIKDPSGFASFLIRLFTENDDINKIRQETYSRAELTIMSQMEDGENEVAIMQTEMLKGSSRHLSKLLTYNRYNERVLDIDSINKQYYNIKQSDMDSFNPEQKYDDFGNVIKEKTGWELAMSQVGKGVGKVKDKLGEFLEGLAERLGLGGFVAGVKETWESVCNWFRDKKQKFTNIPAKAKVAVLNAFFKWGTWWCSTHRDKTITDKGDVIVHNDRLDWVGAFLRLYYNADGTLRDQNNIPIEEVVAAFKHVIWPVHKLLMWVHKEKGKNTVAWFVDKILPESLRVMGSLSKQDFDNYLTKTESPDKVLRLMCQGLFDQVKKEYEKSGKQPIDDKSRQVITDFFSQITEGTHEDFSLGQKPKPKKEQQIKYIDDEGKEIKLTDEDWEQYEDSSDEITQRRMYGGGSRSKSSTNKVPSFLSDNDLEKAHKFAEDKNKINVDALAKELGISKNRAKKVAAYLEEKNKRDKEKQELEKKKEKEKNEEIKLTDEQKKDIEIAKQLQKNLRQAQGKQAVYNINEMLFQVLQTEEQVQYYNRKTGSSLEFSVLKEQKEQYDKDRKEYEELTKEITAQQKSFASKLSKLETIEDKLFEQRREYEQLDYAKKQILLEKDFAIKEHGELVVELRPVFQLEREISDLENQLEYKYKYDKKDTTIIKDIEKELATKKKQLENILADEKISEKIARIDYIEKMMPELKKASNRVTPKEDNTNPAKSRRSKAWVQTEKGGMKQVSKRYVPHKWTQEEHDEYDKRLQEHIGEEKRKRQERKENHTWDQQITHIEGLMSRYEQGTKEQNLQNKRQRTISNISASFSQETAEKYRKILELAKKTGKKIEYRYKKDPSTGRYILDERGNKIPVAQYIIGDNSGVEYDMDGNPMLNKYIGDEIAKAGINVSDKEDEIIRKAQQEEMEKNTIKPTETKERKIENLRTEDKQEQYEFSGPLSEIKTLAQTLQEFRVDFIYYAHLKGIEIPNTQSLMTRTKKKVDRAYIRKRLEAKGISLDNKRLGISILEDKKDKEKQARFQIDQLQEKYMKLEQQLEQETIEAKKLKISEQMYGIEDQLYSLSITNNIPISSIEARKQEILEKQSENEKWKRISAQNNNEINRYKGDYKKLLKHRRKSKLHEGGITDGTTRLAEGGAIAGEHGREMIIPLNKNKKSMDLFNILSKFMKGKPEYQNIDNMENMIDATTGKRTKKFAEGGVPFDLNSIRDDRIREIYESMERDLNEFPHEQEYYDDIEKKILKMTPEQMTKKLKELCDIPPKKRLAADKVWIHMLAMRNPWVKSFEIGPDYKDAIAYYTEDEMDEMSHKLTVDIPELAKRRPYFIRIQNELKQMTMDEKVDFYMKLDKIPRNKWTDEMDEYYSQLCGTDYLLNEVDKRKQQETTSEKPNKQSDKIETPTTNIANTQQNNIVNNQVPDKPQISNSQPKIEDKPVEPKKKNSFIEEVWNPTKKRFEEKIGNKTIGGTMIKDIPTEVIEKATSAANIVREKASEGTKIVSDAAQAAKEVYEEKVNPKLQKLWDSLKKCTTNSKVGTFIRGIGTFLEMMTASPELLEEMDEADRRAVKEIKLMFENRSFERILTIEQSIIDNANLALQNFLKAFKTVYEKYKNNSVKKTVNRALDSNTGKYIQGKIIEGYENTKDKAKTAWEKVKGVPGTILQAVKNWFMNESGTLIDIQTKACEFLQGIYERLEMGIRIGDHIGNIEGPRHLDKIDNRKWYQKAGRKTWNITKTVAKYPFQTAHRAGRDFFTNRKCDIFLKPIGRQELPRDAEKLMLISKEQFEAGVYKDPEAKKMIKSASDIIGPVYDPEGHVLIGETDLVRGIVDIDGTPIVTVGSVLGRMSRHSITGSASGIYRGTRWVGKKAWEYIPFKKGLKASYDFLMGGKDFTKSIFMKFQDVYRADKRKPGFPLLTKVAQENKLVRFHDGEEIKSSYDINRPVVYIDDPLNGEKAKQVAITIEDIEAGLVTVDGRPLTRWANKLGNIVGSGLRLGKKLLGGAFGLGGAALGMGIEFLWNAVKWSHKQLKKKESPYKDVHLKGKIKVGEPVLQGKKIEEKKYYYEDKELVTSAYGIKPMNIVELMDDGTLRVVLKAEEIVKGLVDNEGHSLSAWHGRSVYGKIITGVGALTGWAAKKTWGVIKKAGAAIGTLLGITGEKASGIIAMIRDAFGGVFETQKTWHGKQRELIIGTRLDKIYTVLSEGLPSIDKIKEPTVPKIAGDKDGDGDRDNSYEDQKQAQEKRNQEAKEKKKHDELLAAIRESKSKEKEKKEEKGLLGMLGGLLGNLFGKGKGVLGSILGGIGGLFGIDKIKKWFSKDKSGTTTPHSGPSRKFSLASLASPAGLAKGAALAFGGDALLNMLIDENTADDSLKRQAKADGNVSGRTGTKYDIANTGFEVAEDVMKLQAKNQITNYVQNQALKHAGPNGAKIAGEKAAAAAKTRLGKMAAKTLAKTGAKMATAGAGLLGGPVGWVISGGLMIDTIIDVGKLGYTAAKWLWREPIEDEMDDIRFVGYGLDDKFDYGTIEDMEDDLLDDWIDEDEENRKNYPFDKKDCKKLADKLDILDECKSSEEIDQAIDYINMWYRERFVPIYETYVSIVRNSQIEPGSTKTSKAYKVDPSKVKKEHHEQLKQVFTQATKRIISVQLPDKSGTVAELLPSKKGFIDFISKHSPESALAKRQKEDQKKREQDKQGKDADKKINNVLQQEQQKELTEKEKKEQEEIEQMKKNREKYLQSVINNGKAQKGNTGGSISAIEDARRQAIIAKTGYDSTKIAQPGAGNDPGSATGNLDIAKIQIPKLSGSDGDLGSYVKKYESGRKGPLGIGWDSTGGTSYGTYQCSAIKGSAKEFVDWMATNGGEFGKQFAKAMYQANGNRRPYFETGGTTGPTVDVWKQFASQDPKAFQQLEHAYYKSKFYETAYKNLDKDVKEAVDKDRGLQEALWSTAVQHGPYKDKNGRGAPHIFNQAWKASGGKGGIEFIKAIYENRGNRFGSSKPDVRASVLNRFKEEAGLIIALSQKNGAPQSTDIRLASNESDTTNVPSVANNDIASKQQSAQINNTSIETDNDKTTIAAMRQKRNAYLQAAIDRETDPLRKQMLMKQQQMFEHQQAREQLNTNKIYHTGNKGEYRDEKGNITTINSANLSASSATPSALSGAESASAMQASGGKGGEASQQSVKAADLATSKASQKSKGQCAKYVRTALQGSGYQFTPQPSAYQYATKGIMEQMGFQQIDASSPHAKGDVAVIGQNARHKHGHIQIWNGNTWVSDFIQNPNKMGPYRGGSGVEPDQFLRVYRDINTDPSKQNNDNSDMGNTDNKIDTTSGSTGAQASANTSPDITLASANSTIEQNIQDINKQIQENYSTSENTSSSTSSTYAPSSTSTQTTTPTIQTDSPIHTGNVSVDTVASEQLTELRVISKILTNIDHTFTNLVDKKEDTRSNESSIQKVDMAQNKSVDVQSLSSDIANKIIQALSSAMSGTPNTTPNIPNNTPSTPTSRTASANPINTRSFTPNFAL